MIKEIKWTNSPHDACQIYKPEFRGMKLDEIEKEINFEKEWKPFGYTEMLFSRNTATVFITRN